MVISMEFRLQKVRENNELSQKEIADILKVSQPTYSRWEKRCRGNSTKKTNSICKIFSSNLRLSM